MIEIFVKAEFFSSWRKVLIVWSVWSHIHFRSSQTNSFVFNCAHISLRGEAWIHMLLMLKRTTTVHIFTDPCLCVSLFSRWVPPFLLCWVRNIWSSQTISSLYHCWSTLTNMSYNNRWEATYDIWIITFYVLCHILGRGFICAWVIDAFLYTPTLWLWDR